METLGLDKAIKTMTDKCDGWGNRVEGFVKIIKEICVHYAKFLHVSPLQIFESLEKKRDYSYPNYYQWAKFPKLDTVTVFENREQMLETIKAKDGFRCPACGGISKNYQTCDTGLKMKNGKVCDWKAYGLFGTMGNGLRFIVVEEFLNDAVVFEIFYPVAMEQSQPVPATTT
jgi:hypothetical protein